MWTPRRAMSLDRQPPWTPPKRNSTLRYCAASGAGNHRTCSAIGTETSSLFRHWRSRWRAARASPAKRHPMSPVYPAPTRVRRRDRQMPRSGLPKTPRTRAKAARSQAMLNPTSRSDRATTRFHLTRMFRQTRVPLPIPTLRQRKRHRRRQVTGYTPTSPR